jgi:hypothetical protein
MASKFTSFARHHLVGSGRTEREKHGEISKSEPEKPDELAFKFDRAMPARFFFDRVKSN